MFDREYQQGASYLAKEKCDAPPTLNFKKALASFLILSKFLHPQGPKFYPKDILQTKSAWT